MSLPQSGKESISHVYLTPLLVWIFAFRMRKSIRKAQRRRPLRAFHVRHPALCANQSKMRKCKTTKTAEFNVPLSCVLMLIKNAAYGFPGTRNGVRVAQILAVSPRGREKHLNTYVKAVDNSKYFIPKFNVIKWRPFSP